MLISQRLINLGVIREWHEIIKRADGTPWVSRMLHPCQLRYATGHIQRMYRFYMFLPEQGFLSDATGQTWMWNWRWLTKGVTCGLVGRSADVFHPWIRKSANLQSVFFNQLAMRWKCICLYLFYYNPQWGVITRSVHALRKASVPWSHLF
jgi:hypothetical protein